MAFSTAHIAVTALLVAIPAVLVARLLLRRSGAREVAAVALVSGVTTFGWRLAANADALNRDGITWVSSNDVLAGYLAYLTLGMYAAFGPPAEHARFEKLRVALAALTIVVNVVVI